jgi:hypothetical protein
MRKILLYLFIILIIIVAPFVLLIRGAVYVHTYYEWNAWMSLMAGMIFTGVLLLIYFVAIQGKLTGKLGTVKSLKQKFALVFVIVLVYCMHGVMAVSTENIKNQALRKEFTKMHPILRVSLSTLIHLDEKLILTDALRKPEDYKKMGLKTNRNSLHYPQSDGYVHAVDLRTNGRSEFRNRLIQLYFKWMGFKTLRHVGTADHLHISLYSSDHPRSY